MLLKLCPLLPMRLLGAHQGGRGAASGPFLTPTSRYLLEMGGSGVCTGKIRKTSCAAKTNQGNAEISVYKP